MEASGSRASEQQEVDRTDRCKVCLAQTLSKARQGKIKTESSSLHDDAHIQVHFGTFGGVCFRCRTKLLVATKKAFETMRRKLQEKGQALLAESEDADDFLDPNNFE